MGEKAARARAAVVRAASEAFRPTCTGHRLTSLVEERNSEILLQTTNNHVDDVTMSIFKKMPVVVLCVCCRCCARLRCRIVRHRRSCANDVTMITSSPPFVLLLFFFVV